MAYNLLKLLGGQHLVLQILREQYFTESTFSEIGRTLEHPAEERDDFVERFCRSFWLARQSAYRNYKARVCDHLFLLPSSSAPGRLRT